MSNPALAALPDDHVLWSPETGPVRLGDIRGSVPEENPAGGDEWANTLLMWERRVTRNIRRPRWRNPGDGRSERKA